MLRSLFIGLTCALVGCSHAASELVVYSARNEQLIKPVFDAYTRETGVQVKFTTGDAAVLIEGGYLSNAAEARKVALPSYRQSLAEAVARALK